MNKNIIIAVLSIACLFLTYKVYNSIAEPVRFQETFDYRSEFVIQNLIDIREAQIAYKNTHGEYASKFDTLINFLVNDSVLFIEKVGADDDTIAKLSGDRNLWRRDTIKISALKSIEYFYNDSLRAYNNIPFNLDSLKYIPFSGGKEFELAAGEVKTGSGLNIKVFEAKADYIKFLGDIDNSNNLFDKKGFFRVGNILEANNNAGNWE